MEWHRHTEVIAEPRACCLQGIFNKKLTQEMVHERIFISPVDFKGKVLLFAELIFFVIFSNIFFKDTKC